MDYFKAEYYKACSDSITDVMECIENPAYSLPEERPSITIAESSQFFEGS
ncbi:MAG: hypothetical protein LBC61_02175 [Candidatus Peribacteria bacterium]|jgi:hypothetical protein|nr:hypothetical protein [Candidatus Peribacteria bacterium]